LRATANVMFLKSYSSIRRETDASDGRRPARAPRGAGALCSAPVPAG
jgi:hypothetical protein